MVQATTLSLVPVSQAYKPKHIDLLKQSHNDEVDAAAA